MFSIYNFINVFPMIMINCRVEKVNIRKKSGIAKIGSIVLCMAGVATLAFYKGPHLRTVQLLSGNLHKSQQHENHFSSGKKWILGSILLFLATIMWSFCTVIQVATYHICAIPINMLLRSRFYNMEIFKC